MPTRNARAQWVGTLEAGSGSFATESAARRTGRLHLRAVSGRYNFSTRFGELAGTNPEELIAAAEASCFSMAMGAALAKEGHTANLVETEVSCTITPLPDAGYSITHLHLRVRVDDPGLERADLLRIAESTRASCPVSRALANVPIDMDASFL
jgi:osmotically inducible protein OsmC